jgi:hypothetical protein
MFFGQRERAKSYLYIWFETGELPPSETTLEIYTEMKFREWLESSWATTSSSPSAAATQVAKEVVETIKSEREPRSRGLVMTTNKLLTLAEVGEIEGRRLRVIDKANPSKLAEAALTIHEDIPALCATVRELEARVGKFSTLADERHDLLSAERRANDELRAERTKILQSRDSWRRVAETLEEEKLALRTRATTARAAAVRECVEEVKDRLSVLEAQTASLVDPLAKAGCYGRDSAIREIVAALESLLNKETQDDQGRRTGS